MLYLFILIKIEFDLYFFGADFKQYVTLILKMKMINLAVPRKNLKFQKRIYIEEDYHLVMMKVLAQVNLILEIMCHQKIYIKKVRNI